MSAQDKDQISPVAQVGVSFTRRDAAAKVCGREAYACDFYAPEMLWAGVKRAGVAHARLRGVDTARARELPGVEAVLTHRDVKGSNRQGVVQKDQPVLVDDKVRHPGDAVALVVARDRQTLARALELVELDLEPLPAVFDLDEALADGAPLIHPEHPGGNLLLKGEVTTGRGAEALESCPVVVQATYHLPWQEHAYLETEAGWARLEEDGSLVVTASTQTPFRDRMEVAESLGLDPARVRIIVPYPGGAFGGKDGITVQSLLGLACLACPGRPVKMWLSREESFLAGAKRHRARLHYRLGADREGRLVAMQARLYYDTGPYDHLGGVVMTLGLEHAGGPYRIPHTEIQSYAVYTNNPVGGAFRGFGVPQVAAAVEQTLDRLAAELGMDPLELRRRNLLRRGDLTPVGTVLDCSVGLGECLEALARHRLWRRREDWKRKAPPHTRRGVGLALALHGVGYGPVVPDVAGAKLELTPEGRILLYAGVVDMGQGNATTYLQMASQELNQPPDALELVLPDTARTLPSGSASASRTTYTFGPALLAAARELAARLRAKAADLFMAPVEEVALLPGRLMHLTSGKEIPLARLAAMLDAAERVVTRRHRAPTSPQRPSSDPWLALHGLPHKVFSFAAQLAAVQVDTLTGRVEVKHFFTACDVGNVLNPQLLEQQVQGAVAQGLGYALWEDFQSEKGELLTPDFATYIIPTALDLPDLETRYVRCYEPSGPLGLKGAGELPIDAPLPAVAAAVAEACGFRPARFPLTPERILAGLSGRPSEDQAS